MPNATGIYCKNKIKNVAGRIFVQHNNKTKLLLIKRYDGLWTAPGGKVDKKDLLEQNACFATLTREFKEEVGFELPQIHNITYYDYRDRTRIYLGYIDYHNIGKFKKNREAIEMRLFNVEELINSDFTNIPLVSYVEDSLRELHQLGLMESSYDKLPVAPKSIKKTMAIGQQQVPSQPINRKHKYAIFIYPVSFGPGIHVTVAGFHKNHPPLKNMLEYLSQLGKISTRKKWKINSESMIINSKRTIIHFHSRTLDKISDILDTKGFYKIKGPKHSDNMWHINMLNNTGRGSIQKLINSHWYFSIVRIKNGYVEFLEEYPLYEIK